MDWLIPLKDDKREMFRAAANAQRNVGTILGFHPDFALQGNSEPLRPADSAKEAQTAPEPVIV